MSVINETYSFGEMAVFKKNPVCICKVSKEIQSFFFFKNPLLLKYHSTKLEVKD
jgi:hypothetical protein